MWIESLWQDSDGVIYAWYHYERIGLCPATNLNVPKSGALKSQEMQRFVDGYSGAPGERHQQGRKYRQQQREDAHFPRRHLGAFAWPSRPESANSPPFSCGLRT